MIVLRMVLTMPMEETTQKPINTVTRTVLARTGAILDRLRAGELSSTFDDIKSSSMTVPLSWRAGSAVTFVTTVYGSYPKLIPRPVAN
ncbi:hypothetical protein [Actinophytocola sediminis]